MESQYPKYFVDVKNALTFTAHNASEVEQIEAYGFTEVMQVMYEMARKSFAAGHTFESIVGKK